MAGPQTPGQLQGLRPDPDALWPQVPADSLDGAIHAMLATTAAGNPLSQNQLMTSFGLSRAQATKVRDALAAESNGHPPVTTP